MALTQPRYCWRTRLSSVVEASKSRTASLSARKPTEPCHATNHIKSGGSGDVLQMRSLLPDIPGAAQTLRANPLGNGALNTRSLGIDLGKFLGRFPLSPLFQGEVLLLRTNRDGATRMANGVRTQRARRAPLAVCCRELDLDHLVCPVVNGRSPTAADASLRAGCLLVFPIDEKVISIEAGLLTGLPLMVPAGWTHQVNLVVLLALHQEWCVYIARIHNVLSGQERFAFKLGMNGCRHGIIRDWS